MQLMAIKYRIKYKKVGFSRWLGHLEVTDIIRRACRAALMPLKYSQGFHPLPRISIGNALPVGVESESEFFDIELVDEMPNDEILNELQRYLPTGIEPVKFTKLESASKSIQDEIASTTYEVRFPNWGAASLMKAVNDFNDLSEMTVEIPRKKGVREINLFTCVDELAVVDDCVVELSLNSSKPGIKITEFFQHGLKATEHNLLEMRIVKRRVVWRGSNG